MLKKLLFFIIFPLMILRGFSIGPPPEWVKSCKFSLEADVKPSQIHLQQLIYDRQNHLGEEKFYLHEAIKVLDEIGAIEASKLRFRYDLSYEKIVLHTIRIYRDGQWIDRLKSSQYRLFQNQQQLSSADIYTGDFTLAYFLDDIQAGDVIEYSMSFMGWNPALGSYYEDVFYLQEEKSLEKIYYRVLCPPNQSLFIKPFCTSKTPTIQEINPYLQEWVWEAENTTPYKKEPDEPSWYNPLERFQLTQYHSWEEVILQILRLYPPLPDPTASVNEPMLALVNQWQNLTSDKEEQALLALRFVQDQVRYLGFEEGINKFKPSDPLLVFQHRYGDCKDKAVLLQSLLHLMEISSHPVFVSSCNRKNIREVLPTIIAFNHVIIRIDIEGLTYWVDPSLTFQGGSLADTYCPDYGWGLVIAQGTQNLIPLPRFSVQKPTTISTAVHLISLDTAEVKTSVTYYGNAADAVRRQLKYEGKEKFSELYFNKIPKATQLLPLTIFDTREQNAFTVSAFYQIPTEIESHKKILPISSHILQFFLDKNLKATRTAPYALVYPLWVKEHIHIESPFNTWNIDIDEATEQHASLTYKSALKRGGSTAYYDFEIYHLQDHVPKELIQSYCDTVNRIYPPEALELGLNLKFQLLDSGKEEAAH